MFTPEESKAAFAAVMAGVESENFEAMIFVTKNRDGSHGTAAFGRGDALLDCLRAATRMLARRMVTEGGHNSQESLRAALGLGEGQQQQQH